MEPVHVSSAVVLQFGGNKAIIPESLIMEHADKKYLKLSATSHVILGLLCGSYPKNASLASSPALQEMVTARNEAAKGDGAEESEVDPMFGEALVSKKRKRGGSSAMMDKEVVIKVGEASVACLWQGSRPSRADLAVLIDASMLTAVFNKIAPECQQCFEASKRVYTRKTAWMGGKAIQNSAGQQPCWSKKETFGVAARWGQSGCNHAG